ncbi:MAG: hypothetical protein DRI01_00640 [Chloroflexi bacterium]|nr:MAG: hypothetical protein DRI01_00640 [Chloroflexota bacterium]
MRNGRRSYSIKEKLEAIKLAETIGVKAASEKLGINFSLIYKWRNKKEYFEAFAKSKKNSKEENQANSETDNEISQTRKYIIKFICIFARNALKGIEQGCYTDEQIIRLARILLPIYEKITGLDRKDIPHEETLHKLKIEIVPTNEDK